jgi:hypothetical protein
MEVVKRTVSRRGVGDSGAEGSRKDDIGVFFSAFASSTRGEDYMIKVSHVGLVEG